MEPAFTLTLWLVRLVFLALLYGFLARSFARVQQSLEDERSQARPAGLAVLVARPGGTRHSLRAVSAIGRDPGCDVVLRDEAASLRHAVIELVAGDWWVEDSGSTNGTLLNGAPLRGRALLRYGDELGVGRTTLRLEHT